MSPPNRATPDTLLTQARAATAAGDVDTAEIRYTRLAQTRPGHMEALQFLAERAMRRGQHDTATHWIQAALQARPDHAASWHRLAAVQMNRGDLEAAAASLRRALAQQPDLFVARLRLGMVLERLQDAPAALVAYFGAVTEAQSRGLWRDDTSTPPGMRRAVKQAMAFIDRGRRQLFDAALEPLRQRHGTGPLERVEACLAIHLGERPARFPDPRQRPRFLYFPDLSCHPFHDQACFPAHRDLEAAAGDISEELGHILHQDGGDDTLEPFYGTGQDTRGLLDAEPGRAPAWDAFFFHRHGTRHDARCRRCPRTATMLERLDLVRIRDHAPEILFSVLRPGTHILPHRGVTNTRLVTHLPLIIPDHCALRVGGELHRWQEGRCVTFDDTFEHEAWNRGARTRAVLILDTWHPDLTAIEREAVHDLVVTIGGFNRACKQATI